MCCWLTLLINGLTNTGLPSLDDSLAQYFIQRAPTSKSKQRRKQLLRVLLGVPHPQPAPTTTANRWEPTTAPQPALARSGSQFAHQHTGPAPSLLIRPPFGSMQTTAGRPSQPLPAVYAQPNGLPRFTQPLIEPQIQTQAPPASVKQMLQNDRRTFLTGVFAGVTATLLTAATAYSMVIFSTKKPEARPKVTGTTTTKTAQPTKKTPTAPPTTNQPPIAQANAVHLNSAVTFTIPTPDDPAGAGTTGILVHLNDDRFVAFDATCTHAGCQVDYDTQTTTLICPCHGAQYDPANNAEVVRPPATVPLKPVAIHIDSATGDITLVKK
jgi:Rieske Fe-S protein